jgi:hypothetical protein
MIYEGGKAVAGASQIPKEMYQETVDGVLKKTGLDALDYGTDIKPVGNTTKDFLGDIDLSVDFQKLQDLWQLPPINDEEDDDKTPENDFWEALKVKVQEIDPNATVNRGLKQFHIPAPILNNGDQQPEYRDGKPVAGTKAIVQVDFFVGNVVWMTDMLSGTPQGSNFKAVFRNALLGNIISKSYIKEYSSLEEDGCEEEINILTKNNKRIPNFQQGEKLRVSYVLDFKRGLEKKYEIILLKGKEKRSYRFIVNDQIDGMASFIFGPGTKWSDLNSFEKVFAKFDSDPYFNKKHGDKKDLIANEMIENLDSSQKIMFIQQSNLKQFKEYKNIALKMRSSLVDDLNSAKKKLEDTNKKKELSTVKKVGKTGKELKGTQAKFSKTDEENLIKLPQKIDMIEDALQEIGELSERLNEGAREGIARFKGDSQFTTRDFLEFLRKLVIATNNVGQEKFTIDLAKEPSVDMVEKMDASFMQIGLDEKGEFFMEPNTGGPVNIQNYVQKFGFKKESLDSFEELYNNKNFQKVLKKMFDFYGPFKFDTEMLPGFTHTGDKEGNIVFASTKYKRDKLGSKGAFVVFKSWLYQKAALDWVRPEPAINSAIIAKFKELSSSFQDQWKIYSNESDMRLAGKIPIDFTNEENKTVEGKTFADYLADEVLFSNLLKAFGTTKKSPIRDAFVKEVNGLREELQQTLDSFANNARSKLGDASSKVEGVVLRIKEENGKVLEVKGTSEDFGKQAAIVWKDRMDIKTIEEKFLQGLLKDALAVQAYDVETNSWSEPNLTKREWDKTLKAITTIFKPEQETKESYLKAIIPYVTPNPQETINNFSNSLQLVILNAKNKLAEIRKNYKFEEYKDYVEVQKEKQEPSVDADSYRKTKAFISSLDAIIKIYEDILNQKGINEKKYIATLEKFFGKNMEHAVVARSPQQTSPDFEKRTKIILWLGRAQPWHKGHHNMIKIGKENLKKLGADKIFIVAVRGIGSTENKNDNPLTEDEQRNLFDSIFKNDSQVEISNVFPTKTLPEILINKLIYNTGYVLVGWLSGPDREASYEDFIKDYVPQAFKANHEYAPVDFNPITKEKVTFIKTPRVFSATEARESTHKLDFETWFKEVAPGGISADAKKQYEIIYNAIKQRTDPPKTTQSDTKKIQEAVISLLNETIKKKGNKYCLLSKKTNRNLGCYRTKAAAKKRERQIQFFKRLKEETAAGLSAVAGHVDPNKRKKDEPN